MCLIIEILYKMQLIKSTALIIFWLTILSFQSCLSDLRPKDFRNEIKFTSESKEKAIQILEKYAQYAGAEKWEDVKTYEVDFTDNFYGIKGGLAKPYPDKKNQFKLRYEFLKERGTMTFLKGKNKNQIWGYDEGVTYTRADYKSEALIKKSKKIEFWLPTYQYFIEFPLRISKADVIYHVGVKKYGLNNYDLILVSWKTPAPQRKLDQYLIWVNQSTGLVDKLQYTIRDQGAILKGTAILDEYQNYNGIQIPSLFKVYLKEDSTKPLHIMRVFNFTANRFDPTYLKVSGGQ